MNRLTKKPGTTPAPLILICDDEVKGTEVSRRLHSDPLTSAFPVIIVNALNFESDRVLERVRAALKDSGELENKGVRLDTRSHKAFVHGSEVPLTLTEFKFLHEFLADPGAVITRERLLKLLPRVEEEYSSRVIDVHLVSLRKKLGASGELIETIRGVGYRFKD